MKTEEVKSIKIEFEGAEADTFKSAINKIEKESGKVGFNNGTLNSDEVKLIRDINEKLNSK